MITPMILLVLYVTFLANVYRDSLLSAIPEMFLPEEKVLDGCVTGQLMSALLGVCCVTVAFCSNLIMVQDKVTGARGDIDMTPAKPFLVSLSYFIATFLNTVMVCLLAGGVCMGYLALTGWYLSVGDVLFLLLDIVLLSLFGTALSSVINSFLSTQGQISAVSAIVSAVYGFLCGAYMPISTFSKGLRTVLGLFPGTHGTSLFRNHALRGVLSEIRDGGAPEELIRGLRDMLDCNIYIADTKIPETVMYAVLVGSILALVAIFVLLSAGRRKKK